MISTRTWVALGITATELIALAESRTAQRVSETAYNSGNIAFRKISYGNLNCFRAELAAGEEVSRQEIHQDEYEVCWVIRGIPEDALSNPCNIGKDTPVSLEFVITDYLRHLRHHVNKVIPQ